MIGVEQWKMYVQSVLGCEVQDAAEKFAALAESEQRAWAAVATVASAVVPQ